MTALRMYDAASAPSLSHFRGRAVALSHYMTRSFAGSSFQVGPSRAAGFGALQNMEGYATELRGASRAKGRAFAEEALAAVAAGTPRNMTVAIDYSFDYDETNMARDDDAMRGVNDAHHGTGIAVGVYAEFGLIKRFHAMGLTQVKGWLTMSEGFSGRPTFLEGMRSGLVGIVQQHDANGDWLDSDVAGTDVNTILDPYNSGIWWPDGSPYLVSHPTPAPGQSDAGQRQRRSAAEMTQIIVVDPVECRQKKVPWPGWFLVIPTAAGSALEHIASTGRLHALQRLGLRVSKRSLTTYHELGGK